MKWLYHLAFKSAFRDRVFLYYVVCLVKCVLA